MADQAEQSSCRRIAGMLVLYPSRRTFVLEESSNVCHIGSRDCRLVGWKVVGWELSGVDENLKLRA